MRIVWQGEVVAELADAEPETLMPYGVKFFSGADESRFPCYEGAPRSLTRCWAD